MLVHNEKMENKTDKIEAFFNRLDALLDKYPILERLSMILFVVGVICYIIWRILVHVIATIIWMVTAFIELCLIPVYCLTWLLFGKFPMFKMHIFVLERLKLFHLIYSK